MKKAVLVGSIFAAQIIFAPAFAIPSGSYIQTCKGIQESTYSEGSRKIDRLSASCQDLQGRWVNTHLDNYRLCNPGIIVNNNGNLQCRKYVTR
ncbi:hypothetical protein [Calothrix sp. PCC 6303]|uniref:hypothetical protein n=1 Tax=Calothrix sp. PCC 6303 TaxID=1170562 RepID=UPI0002A033FD|nr:hypothetical protein [Calothrix sp. PCC 6303]AFZ01157.1 cyanovirin containing protein [Calothrix sp. PCC 6303]